MWNKFSKKSRNCLNLKRIRYYCTEEDLGRKKVSEKERHKKAYAKIFQKKAHTNMKERLKTFHQLQSKIKQHHEEKTD